MPKMNRPYPLEFRREAVRLVRTSDKTVPEIAGDLGVSGQSLRNWVRQADVDEGRRDGGLTTAERQRLRGLERENKTLRMERDLLKKPRPSSPQCQHEACPAGFARFFAAPASGWWLVPMCGPAGHPDGRGARGLIGACVMLD